MIKRSLTSTSDGHEGGWNGGRRMRSHARRASNRYKAGEGLDGGKRQWTVIYYDASYMRILLGRERGCTGNTCLRPKRLVCEVNEEVTLTGEPRGDLMEEITTSEEHHVSRLKSELKAQLGEAESSTNEVANVSDTRPSPVWIRLVPVTGRPAIKHNLPTLPHHAFIGLSKECLRGILPEPMLIDLPQQPVLQRIQRQ